ncbi:uncharacterized protein LOC111395192 [Olea europaea var. sylvestris]|uniref:uncharacterized protein LOC111395192 n=1 Tax=Olea europaea var. sylvestris TaxID=158386 RepID=UPI000C1D5346|nr:uncharacterized protein LOC111395192 [Olea europaea var. sylvestris]
MIVHVHLLSGSFQFAVFELFPCNIVLKRILISSVMYCLIIMLAVSSRTKHLKHLDGDDLYKDLNILDIDLGFNDCEELCGESLADSQQFFEDGGIDTSFEIGSMPGSQINTKCAYAIKDFLASQTKVKQMAFSNPVSGDPVTSCQTGPNTCLPRKALSTCSLSFSGLTGESSTEDHHEWDVFYAYNG